MALIQPIDNGKVVDLTSDEDKAPKTNELGYDQFLQLLCAEMQYQDPLEPTSNTEYVAQLATFSQMEAMLNMQNTIESSNANNLVGKYVIVKSTSANGNTTAEAGFVDYVQYEGTKQYLYINGNRYSIDDVYQVADTEYMEALALAEAFKQQIAKLPSPDDLTLADKDTVEKIAAVYAGMTSYQQSYIDKDTMEKFSALVQKMNELVAADKKPGDGEDNTTGDTPGTEGSGDGDKTEGASGTEENK